RLDQQAVTRQRGVGPAPLLLREGAEHPLLAPPGERERALQQPRALATAELVLQLLAGDRVRALWQATAELVGEQAVVDAPQHLLARVWLCRHTEASERRQRQRRRAPGATHHAGLRSLRFSHQDVSPAEQGARAAA